MSEELLARAPRVLPLTEWDRRELDPAPRQVRAFEPLRQAIESAGAKAEQEPCQQQLLALLRDQVGRDPTSEIGAGDAAPGFR